MILTAKQKKAICAKYAAGGVSKKTLAIEYGVSEKTIYNVVKGDKGFSEKVRNAKIDAEKAAEQSMVDFLCSRSAKAQTLIDKLMAATEADIEKASMREKMGAIKVLSETMIAAERERKFDATGSGVTVNISFADTSVPQGESDDNNGT